MLFIFVLIMILIASIISCNYTFRNSEHRKQCQSFPKPKLYPVFGIALTLNGMKHEVVPLYFVFIFLCSIFIFMLLFYNWRWPSDRRLGRKLSCAKMWPIFGVGFDFVLLKHSELFDYIGNLFTQLGPIFYFEILGLPYVFLSDPRDIEVLLNSSQHLDKGTEYLALLPWLCEGLLTSTGSKWHMRRKMLTPTFHFKILENFIPIFNRNAKFLTKKLIAGSAHAAEIDVDTYVSLCTLDTICETAMGTSLNFQSGEAKEYVSSIRKVGEIILKKSVTFWMFNDWIFYSSPIGREYNKTIKQLHRFTEKVIRERKESFKFQPATLEEIKLGKKRRTSFLDCLIEMQRENPAQMTDRGLREEVDTFMFEGHDTTSVSITWTLLMIAIHKNVQEKVHEEIDNIFGDSDRDATYHDLKQMYYLEMVIKESLRLYPSVPYISRFSANELKIRNYVIPSKTNVSIVPYLVHRNPDIYPDPENFIPERFLPHLIKERHPYAYIPFSAGYRNCIGQKFAMLEEKVMISSIMRRLKLDSTLKKKDMKVLPEVILRPIPKIMITFTPRRSSKE